jgi:hypothetical protein
MPSSRVHPCGGGGVGKDGEKRRKGMRMRRGRKRVGRGEREGV